MKVHLDKIKGDGLHLDFPLSQAWLAEALGSGSPMRPVGDGRLSVHLSRIEEIVHVRGRARLKLEAKCSRCLEPVALGLDAPVEVALFPRGAEPSAAKDGELADDDMGVSTYVGHEIDLSDVVHDEVFLELPMSPVCGQTCAGLCPQCGANRNQNPCDCRPPVDHRWQALLSMKLD